MTLEGKYEYYRCMQHDFNEAYKLVNNYVTELYLLPKKFIDTTGPVLDRYISEYSFADERTQLMPFENVLHFIEQLDDFTVKTVDLFNQHKTHFNQSCKYLNKVADLKETCQGKIVSEYAVDFIELTPELTRLTHELKTIKEKAEEMVSHLEKLELRWATLRVAVCA